MKEPVAVLIEIKPEHEIFWGAQVRPQLRAGYKARRALDSAIAMSRLVGYGSSQKTF
jgi:hypothetical protein